MTPVSYIRFAQVALQISQEALPAYRTRFSKHTFSQPQLLALLCLMHYAHWSLREAEVQLAASTELRQALTLSHPPDHATVGKFLHRLSPELLDQVLQNLLESLPAPQEARTIAIDDTGLAPDDPSSYFLHRTSPTGQPLSWLRYLHWVIAVDCQSHLLLAQWVAPGPLNPTALLAPLATQAVHRWPTDRILADAAFDSEVNHQYLRQTLGVESIIPAKRPLAPSSHGFRQLMRTSFPTQLYRQRAQVESVFSCIKRVFSRKIPGRSWPIRLLQTLLLGLAYDIYLL